MTLQATTTTTSSSSASLSRKQYRKLFQDSIVVDIPLDDDNNAGGGGVTADMGVVLERTRTKRIQSIYQHFPSLAKTSGTAIATASDTPGDDAKEAKDDDGDDDEQEEEDDERDETGQHPQPPSKKRPKNETLPQREHYGSVMDYLEAKYVRGVMLADDDDDEDGAAEDDDNDKESVYSENSWLDDSLLKRDVAEQVLSHSTQTKVGVENDDYQDDFFVNVGNLEVEDNDMLNYDPLQEETLAKHTQKSNKKKRKRSSDASTTKSNKSAKTTGGANNSSDGASLKKKQGEMSSGAVSASNKEASLNDDTAMSDTAVQEEDSDSEELIALKRTLEQQRTAVKKMADRIVAEIKAMPKEDLPRKKKTVKVSLSVPEGKKVGDVITFSNPHVPGQRLKVQVPKDKGPGETFTVSMPAPQVTDESDGNKFTREVQELIADYATLYDALCQVEAEYHQADPNQKGKYPLKAKRIAKFDEMVKLFPSNLVTPLDAPYMKKIVRRARQNKKKRKEGGGDDDQTMTSAFTAAAAAAMASAKVKPTSKAATTASAKAKPTTKPDVKSIPKATKHKLLKAVKPAAKAMESTKSTKPGKKAAVPKTREIVLPSLGRVFPKVEFKHEEFAHMTNH